jgi:ABC-type branched-subunit amino acid transport system substrate-binding protein
MTFSRAKWFLSLAAVGVGMTWLAAPSVAEEPSYKIGVVAALSGAGAVNGDASLQGLNVALEEINGQNLAGRKIEVVTADDATDPKTSAEVCSRLVLQDKVNIIIGSQTTPARIACNQLAEKNGVPYISASSAPGDLCAPNIVTLGPVANQMTDPLIDYVIKKGLKKFYFIGSDYAAARAGEKLASAHIKAAGGELVGISYVPLGASDLATEFGKIAAAKPDVVIDIIVGAEILTFHKQFANDPRLASIKRADNFVKPGDIKQLGAAADGVMVGAGYFPEVNTPKSNAFKDALKKKYGDKANPDIWSMLAYEAMHMVANSVKKVGPKGADVLADFKQAKYDSPAGPVAITNNYNTVPVFIGEGQKDGSIRIIESTPPIAPVLACQFKS